jgi:hypothetical protein
MKAATNRVCAALSAGLQGNTARRVGELTGHTASVTHIALDERLSHVFTLGADKTIKARCVPVCLRQLCQLRRVVSLCVRLLGQAWGEGVAGKYL